VRARRLCGLPYEALLEADAFEDLPGKWQAAILEAEGIGRSCGR
jgi:hypothetical protein